MSESSGLQTGDLPLESLLDSAPDGVLVVDSGGCVLLANATLATLFGYSREELLGINVEALVPERLRPGHYKHRDDYQASPRSRPMGLGLKLLGRKKDGSEFPVEISLSPLTTAAGDFVTAVIRDVSEREALEKERNFLAIELETEHERDRIAMDLHDGIMQDIYAATLRLELAHDDVMARAEDAEQNIERAIEQLHEVVRNIRSYIFDLRPRQYAGDLAAALQDLMHEFEQNSRIKTEVQVEPITVEPSVGIVLYNIAHEGLSNVQKHAGAGLVSLRLSIEADVVALELRDNGRGFDTGAAVSEEHRGLRNMANRARSIGAEFSIQGSPGGGTCLSVRYPLYGNR